MDVVFVYYTYVLDHKRKRNELLEPSEIGYITKASLFPREGNLSEPL